MKGGNCQLVQGEICRSCRFKGCILAGMNPYSIRAQSSQTIQMKEGIQFFERQKGQLLKGLTKAATSSNSKEDIFIEMTEPYEKTNSQTMELKLEPFIPGHAESQLLNWLLDVDEKMLRIRYSETEIRADSYYTKSLYDILQDGENLLAKAETFSGDRRMARSLQYYVSQIEQGNMDFMKISWLFIDVFLCFQLAKTIPAIRELSIEDQTTLLANNALTAVVMNQSYYSLLMQNELDLMVFPNGFSPICFTRNPSINSIKRKLFDKNLRPYKRIELSREEFLLLRVIQLLQTAPANLSKAGCNTLQAHLEKYSKLLMHYERSRLGHLGGVQRYAELMFFTSAVRNIGYEHQNFLAYMTTVMMKEGPLKTDQPHPDYMDNVIFGIVGKIKREEQQAEVPRPWINSQAAKFIRDNF